MAGGISVLGMGSGLDINKIVLDLITAEKAAPTKRLDTREAAFKEQLSGIGTFQGAVSEFRNALSNITGASKFQSLTASVGNTALFTASATSVAQAGSYNVEVTQLAQAQKLATDPNHRHRGRRLPHFPVRYLRQRPQYFHCQCR